MCMRVCMYVCSARVWAPHMKVKGQIWGNSSLLPSRGFQRWNSSHQSGLAGSKGFYPQSHFASPFWGLLKVPREMCHSQRPEEEGKKLQDPLCMPLGSITSSVCFTKPLGTCLSRQGRCGDKAHPSHTLIPIPTLDEQLAGLHSELRAEP